MPTIKITGMRCGHCVAAVTKALGQIAGVAEVRVDLEKAEATYVEQGPVSPATVQEAIAKIGFEVVS